MLLIKSSKFILPILISFVISFISGHLLLVYFDHLELDVFAQENLARTQDVYDDSSVMLFQPIRTQTLCSKKDLDFLRHSLWGKEYLKDVGRIDDQNRLLCSATWGKLSVPIPLSEPDITWAKGVKHWGDTPNILSHNLPDTKILAYKNTAVLISPYAFKNDFEHSHNINSIITTLDQQHTLRTLARAKNDTSGVQLNGGLSIRRLSTTMCSEKASVCVIAQTNKAGVFGLCYQLFSVFLGLVLIITWLISSVYFKLNTYRRSMLYRLKKAITNESLTLEFQPKIALSSQQTVGVEALVRWHDKHLGKVPPDVFIDLAISSNQINKLTRVVIKQTFELLAPTLKQNPALTVSINLSMQDLADETLLSFINQQVNKHQVLHEQCIFEITERSIIDLEQVELQIKRFAESHYKVSLDDFGTGYANLSWLGSLNTQEIKIDKIFTQSIGTNTVNAKTLTAIFALLRELDLSMVFEGIETQEQADVIYANFPDAIAQGWLYAPSLPLDALEAYLEQNTR